MAGSRHTSSIRSGGSSKSTGSNGSHERTPLLSRSGDDGVPAYGEQTANGTSSPAARSLREIQDDYHGHGKGRRGTRWATVIALSTLSAIVLAILGLGFAAPAAVEEYAKEALVFTPTTLSVDSFTSTGIRARVQGTFELDQSKVHKKSIRDIGKAVTYVAKEIETGESELRVYLPAYDNLLMGTAKIPPIKLNIRPGHTNFIDFLTDLEPGELDGFRRLANDWLHGRLGQLEVKGVTSLDFKSGIFKFGNRQITQILVLAGETIPTMPAFDVSKLNFYEVQEPLGEKAMAAEASVSIKNEFPVHLDVPILGFDILVPNCRPKQEYLLLAKSATEKIQIKPNEPVIISVSAIIKQFPPALVTACPGSATSPLDALLADYMAGQDTTVYIHGTDSPSEDTPSWVSDLLKSVTVPLPFPGHTFDNLIRNFSLADVHFSLPDPTAEPDEPEAQPRISAVVKALVGLPEEMNFPLDVDRVRADAEVFFKGRKLGQLDLRKWQAANTTRVEDKDAGPALLVESVVEDAPLHITDNDLFTEVVQALIFGAKGVMLQVKAKVDVETVTALGDFVVREVPADGEVLVDPFRGGMDFSNIKPTFGNISIEESTADSLSLRLNVNLTNPTEYSTFVPYVNINILANKTVLGHAVARNLTVAPGNNTNLEVRAKWEPFQASGVEGKRVGRELLSQYISGFNTTLTLKTHENSIPSQPALGKALSILELTIDALSLTPPSPPEDGNGDHDGDEEGGSGPHFIKDATVLSTLITVS